MFQLSNRQYVFKFITEIHKGLQERKVFFNIKINRGTTYKCREFQEFVVNISNRFSKIKISNVSSEKHDFYEQRITKNVVFKNYDYFYMTESL